MTNEQQIPTKYDVNRSLTEKLRTRNSGIFTVRLKVMAGVELQGGNLLPRAQGGRAQNPRWMARDSSILWNPFREQLGFPMFPLLKDSSRTVRHTSSNLPPHHPYRVGLRGPGYKHKLAA